MGILLYYSIPSSILRRSLRSHCPVFSLRPVPHCTTGELKPNKSESLWELVTCWSDPNLWNTHHAGPVSVESSAAFLLGLSLVLYLVYI